MQMYQMFLIIEEKEYRIPVLPPKLMVSSPGQNERTKVLELGEILLLRKKGLKTVSWESFFPKRAAPYTISRVPEPLSMIQAIQRIRDLKKPLPLASPECRMQAISSGTMVRTMTSQIA